MISALPIVDKTVQPSDLIPLLGQYQLLPQLLKELIIDQAIQDVQLGPEEVVQAVEQFYRQHQIGEEARREAWLKHYRMTPQQLAAQAQRQLKLHKFKLQTWNNQVESDFLQQKGQFDQYVYSLIRVASAEVAQELYFRLQAGEQAFADLATKYSQGPEAQTGGLIGPVTAANLHPTLVQILTSAQPGQVRPPIRLGEWFVIVSLQKLISAQLDAPLRQQLLEQRFNEWLQLQLKSAAISDDSIAVSARTP
ncbi:peptidylprolyl isomerase [Acaryochloris sp. 'Moss Beach']|uniref:peptidylprolyl isomerase n=1 Tax=Acaryochloris TaxID=155977 RepID=UPI001BAF5D4A|nr:MULTISPECIES: peptidylprolyl isomerase [Acaryochloris]QUY42677.1 peptidylprolyl isomerase [Acaryochloris marina S15]UJB71757.1 peptidylprolyl isomerase [Acaryochloris sp. 'Moss Beach']